MNILFFGMTQRSGKTFGGTCWSDREGLLFGMERIMHFGEMSGRRCCGELLSEFIAFWVFAFEVDGVFL
jgi:hypothetical protein